MASNEEILAGLAEIVNEETGLAPEAVELDKSFTEDLDIDSISMMTIVVNAEEKFGVRIPDEEVKNLKTVGDAVSFICWRPGLAPPSWRRLLQAPGRAEPGWPDRTCSGGQPHFSQRFSAPHATHSGLRQQHGHGRRTDRE
jgi:acyl carrier protein